MKYKKKTFFKISKFYQKSFKTNLKSILQKQFEAELSAFGQS